jgi:hypothetical protein
MGKNNKKMATPDEVKDFESLYESAWKCRSGVGWKPSTKSFTLNGIENCLEMEEELKTGTWKHGKPKPIAILYPKRRDGLSIPFRDRVYQRSLNDNSLYPCTTNSFIYDNAACQKGKGTDFARARIKKFLWRHFAKHGLKGWIVQIDIHGYYSSMPHQLIQDEFGKSVSDDILGMSMSVLEHQYSGDIGCNPGSQMVQIAGISVLNPVDHYIKEKLHVKNYIRYMDDFWMLLDDYGEAEHALSETIEKIKAIGFDINPKKTQITPLSEGFLFLGFHYQLTETGKVIMTLNSQSIRHERRKLRKMVGLVKKGKMSKAKVYECYGSWRDFAGKGNTSRLLVRMDAYLKSLWEGDE